MRKIIVIAFIVSLSVNAQNKLLTIQDAVLKGRTSLAPKRLQNLSFIPGTKSFVFIEDNKLQKGDNASGKTKQILQLSELNKSLKESKLDTLKAFVPITFKSEHSFVFMSGTKQVNFDLEKKVCW